MSKRSRALVGPGSIGTTELPVVTLGPVLTKTLGTIKGGGGPLRHGLVAQVERLDPSNLERLSPKAFELYEHCFPNPDEREPIEDIVARINRYATDGPDADGGDFHAHVFLDRDERVIAYSQGSTMPCGNEANVCYFWQYGAVADDDFLSKAYKSASNNSSARNKGVSKVIHLINELTIRSAAEKMGAKALGELWECEQKGFGETVEEIRFSRDRLVIHNRAGGKVMMGVDKNDPKALINLHLQPRLTKDSEPIALHLMFRSFTTADDFTTATSTMSTQLAQSIVLDGFVANFIKEGFAKEDVDEAYVELQKRFSRVDHVLLLPAKDVPDAIVIAKTDELFRKQLLDLYDVEDLDKAREKYQAAMGS